MAIANGPRTVVYAHLDFQRGGAQQLALTIWRHIDRRRYRPHLLCVRSRGALVPEAESLGVPITDLGRLRRPYDVGAVGKLLAWFRRCRPAIVHVPLYSRASPYVRLAARLANVPVIVAHEHCRPGPISRQRKFADRLLARGTNFVAVSEAMRAMLLEAGVPARQITVIENGIDTDRFAPGDRLLARRSLGLGSEGPIILMPARLEPRKRHVDLLAAMLLLGQEFPSCRALCAGGGPWQEPLVALGTALGLEDSVRWVGERSDMPQLYAAADVVCLPSRLEGLPLVLLEAMACGRAVVAARAPGVDEAVEDGRTGLLAAVGRPSELAQALAQLLAQPSIRAAMEIAARQRAVARFDARRMVERLMAAYDCFLASARGTGRAFWKQGFG